MQRTGVFEAPSAVLEVNDRERVARNPPSRSRARDAAPGAALEVLGVGCVHIDVEPIVVIEIAVLERCHAACEVLACIVHV